MHRTERRISYLKERVEMLERLNIIEQTFVSQVRKIDNDNFCVYRSCGSVCEDTESTEREKSVDSALHCLKHEPVDADLPGKWEVATRFFKQVDECRLLVNNSDLKKIDQNCMDGEEPSGHWIVFDLANGARNCLSQMRDAMKKDIAFNTNGECPICQEPFHSEVSITQCKHQFCKNCLDVWKETCGGFAKCPLCMTCLYEPRIANVVRNDQMRFASFHSMDEQEQEPLYRTMQYLEEHEQEQQSVYRTMHYLEEHEQEQEPVYRSLHGIEYYSQT